MPHNLNLLTPIRLRRRRPILLHPLGNPLKIPTHMMHIKVRRDTNRTLRVDFDQHGRDVAIAHQTQPDALNAVVHMHARSDRVLEIAGWDRVEVPPGVLADDILRDRRCWVS